MTLRGLALARMELPGDPRGQRNAWTTYALISCPPIPKLMRKFRMKIVVTSASMSRQVCNRGCVNFRTIGVERETIDQLSAEVLEKDA